MLVRRRRSWFVLHEEVPRRAEGEGGDGRVGSEEALVVAVVGDAVLAGSIVVHKAEVVGCTCENLRRLAELVEAVGDATGGASAVAGGGGDRGGGFSVDEIAIGEEAGSFVDPEDGGAGRVEGPEVSGRISWGWRGRVYYRGVFISVSVGPRLILYCTR